MFRARKRMHLAAVVAALAFAASCSEPSGDRAFLTATDRLPFDPASWAKGSERWSMCDDLRRNHLRAGMSHSSVLDLLGAPTLSDQKGLHYDVSGYWLDVLFDERDRLRASELDEY
jgi:hypothetical protein